MRQFAGRTYRRRIRSTDRGATFASRTEFENAVRRQCVSEFVEARSPELLEEFRRRLETLNAHFGTEVRSHRVLTMLLRAIDQARDVGRAMKDRADLAPRAMVSTRVLASVADDLVDLRLALSSRLNLAADESLDEARNVAADEEVGAFYDLHHDWPDALEQVSWRRMPGHRERVFIALRQCDGLGSRREFRTLAAASLLAAGETVTFKPNCTTIADAIEFEAKRMREVALRLGPSWAANLEQHEGTDESEQSPRTFETALWSDDPSLEDAA